MMKKFDKWVEIPGYPYHYMSTTPIPKLERPTELINQILKGMRMATTVDNTINDFGFSFADESEILRDSDTVVKIVANRDEYQKRLEAVMKLISPFLKNLQANPDQAYLKWPDRGRKVAEFEKKIIAASEGRPL